MARVKWFSYQVVDHQIEYSDRIIGVRAAKVLIVLHFGDVDWGTEVVTVFGSGRWRMYYPDFPMLRGDTELGTRITRELDHLG